MQIRLAIDLFLDGYFSTCRRSERTLTAYTTDLNQFIEFLPSPTLLEEITPRILEKWVAQLKTHHYAPASVKRKLATLKVFLRYWVRQDLLTTSPFEKLRLDLAPDRRLPIILDLSEINQLLSQAGSLTQSRKKTQSSNNIDRHFIALRNQTILETLFATGIRIGELCKIQFQDILLERGTITITGKGRKQRQVIIPDAHFTAILERYIAARKRLKTEHSHLFINYTGSQLSTQGASKALRKIAQKAAIEKHITPHMIRHTVATLLLQGGADLRTIQTLLGHSSITTTEIYTHISARHLGEEIRRTHPSTQILNRKTFSFNPIPFNRLPTTEQPP